MKDDPLLEKYGYSRNGHSLFAPSASASWLNCSGSLLVNAVAADSAGFEAAQGTIAHSVAEEWSKTGVKPVHRLGTIERSKAGGVWHDVEVTSDMLNYVERFVDWCAELPGHHYYEQHVDLSPLTPIPNQGGTADHFACEPGILTITDLKYGTGVRVYALGNSQAMLYAAGAFLEWDWIYGFERIVIRICQPRLDVFETWEVSRAQLLEFMEHVKVQARKAWQENAPRSPSPKACRWCAGAETCPARVRELDDLIDQTYEDGDENDRGGTPKTYTAEDLQSPTAALASLGAKVETLLDRPVKALSVNALAYAYGFRSTVEKWFADIGELLLDRAERGEQIPYFKLTEGRQRRKWKDKDEAIRHLKQVFGLDEDAVAPRIPVSVKQAETLIRAKTGMQSKKVTLEIGRLIDIARTKRTLVPVDDDRPSSDELLDDFEAEDDNEGG